MFYRCTEAAAARPDGLVAIDPQFGRNSARHGIVAGMGASSTPFLRADFNEQASGKVAASFLDADGRSVVEPLLFPGSSSR